MKVLKTMVHTAMRDDTALRTTLAHTATPYGVYEGHFPAIPDFSAAAGAARSYVTWQFLGGAGDGTTNGPEMRLGEKVFSVTVWSSSPDTVEDAHRRIRRILIDLKACTLPTTDAAVNGLKQEPGGIGPDLFDDEYKAYFRSETYRVWYREDITS